MKDKKSLQTQGLGFIYLLWPFLVLDKYTVSYTSKIRFGYIMLFSFKASTRVNVLKQHILFDIVIPKNHLSHHLI